VALTDEPWAVLAPFLVEACRPRARVPPSDLLRRTVRAIAREGYHQSGRSLRGFAIACTRAREYILALPRKEGIYAVS
jgi:hypothetical protein